eukprot:224229_1
MSVRPRCAGGCGFYGNKEHENYCSVCFKKMFPQEAFKLAEKQPTIITTNKNQKSKINEINESKEEIIANDSKNPKDKPLKKEDIKPKKKIQKKRHRCWNCRKKIPLAAQFECKCGYVFCSMHRFHDAHNCDYDWKTQHTKHLASKNPEIAAPKVPGFE